MAEIINLNKARKARAREAAKSEAAANRAAHGRTRADRDVAEAERLKREKALDGSLRERPVSPSDTTTEPDQTT